MWIEQQREYMRDILLEVLTDSVSIRSAGLDIGAAMSGKPPENQNVFASGTRPRGTSKIICSLNVFKHNKIKAAVMALPELERRWILYRYGETYTDSSINELFEVMYEEIDTPTRKDAQERTEKLLRRVLRTRRELVSHMSLKPHDELDISRQVYCRRWKKKEDEFEKHCSRVDERALDALLTVTRITRKVRY